jgi:hypothetical protein
MSLEDRHRRQSAIKATKPKESLQLKVSSDRIRKLCSSLDVRVGFSAVPTPVDERPKKSEGDLKYEKQNDPKKSSSDLKKTKAPGGTTSKNHSQRSVYVKGRWIIPEAQQQTRPGFTTRTNRGRLLNPKLDVVQEMECSPKSESHLSCTSLAKSEFSDDSSDDEPRAKLSCLSLTFKHTKRVGLA